MSGMPLVTEVYKEIVSNGPTTEPDATREDSENTNESAAGQGLRTWDQASIAGPSTERPSELRVQSDVVEAALERLKAMAREIEW